MPRKEILLESGTNEIEIMEFTIYDEMYGINVAKVREIIMSNKVKPMPHSHKAVEGIFKPRDIMLTVVDLPYYLSGTQTEPRAKDLFMITNFNKLNIAFRVHTVVGIHRISWEDINKPDKTLTTEEEGIFTGITQCDGGLVSILDFEKIVADIAPGTGIQIDDVSSGSGGNREKHPIILVEDSVLLTRMIQTSLVKAGYSDIRLFNNGKEAWEYLESLKEDTVGNPPIDLVITDIEMPQMDGHRLTKLLKEDEILKKIPLVIFSSLISPEMEMKGKELGADAQLSKPEIGHLVDVMDDLLQEGRK